MRSFRSCEFGSSSHEVLPTADTGKCVKCGAAALPPFPAPLSRGPAKDLTFSSVSADSRWGESVSHGGGSTQGLAFAAFTSLRKTSSSLRFPPIADTEECVTRAGRPKVLRVASSRSVRKASCSLEVLPMAEAGECVALAEGFRPVAAWAMLAGRGGFALFRVGKRIHALAELRR